MNKPDSTTPTAVNPSNEHVIRIARGVMSLPKRAVHRVHLLWSRLVSQMTTQKHLDDTDKLRQTRIRRELRGLPADHDPTAPRPPR